MIVGEKIFYLTKLWIGKLFICSLLCKVRADIEFCKRYGPWWLCFSVDKKNRQRSQAERRHLCGSSNMAINEWQMFPCGPAIKRKDSMALFKEQ